MNGEVILVLSLEGRYYNCHERAQRAKDNYDIVTRVIHVQTSVRHLECFEREYAGLKTISGTKNDIRDNYISLLKAGDFI